MLYPVMRYFRWLSLPFHAFIIISMCAHLHGSVKHWWHSLQSINEYMVTSTKIWYLGSFCSFMKLQWVSYEMLHDVYMDYISICKSWEIFYVVSCDMLSCLQHILNWSCWILSIYDVCMLCDRAVIYQCTCVFVHHYGILYFNILYLYHISCFWCFNIHLFVLLYGILI